MLVYHLVISFQNLNFFFYICGLPQCLEEKVRCEKIEVDSLKSKAAEMLASGQQSHAASQAQKILNKFDALAEKIKVKLVSLQPLPHTHIFCI